MRGGAQGGEGSSERRAETPVTLAWLWRGSLSPATCAMLDGSSDVSLAEATLREMKRIKLLQTTMCLSFQLKSTAVCLSGTKKAKCPRGQILISRDLKTLSAGSHYSAL